jgi:GST-like protein
MLAKRMLDEEAWEKYPNVKRWVDELRARPAVEKGLGVGKELREREYTEEEEKARRALLFNQTNDQVRAAREAAARQAAG